MEDENDQNGNEKALDDSDEYDITLNDSKNLKVHTFFTLSKILIHFTKKENQLSTFIATFFARMLFLLLIKKIFML